MTIYNTNIAKNYALTAGFNSAWAGIREIIQNALDGHDKGHFMRIEHGKARDRSGAWALKVSNEGVTLSTDALVLGFSTKREDSAARGQHGEGLIVGINSLLNFGHEVWIRTGDEAWIAKHVLNENGLEVLVIDIRKQPKRINDFIVEIKGVSPSDWEAYKARLLHFNNKNDPRINLKNGSILLDPKYQNDLFVKGIYVCKLPNNYSFGYNLNIDLNRDREVANPWDLFSTIRELIMEATEKKLFKVEEILTVLNDDSCGESQAFAYTDFYGYSGGFNKMVADHFISQNGEAAMPVTSIGDSQRVEHFGKKGVVVSQSIKNIIEKYVGKLADRLNKSAMDKKTTYSWNDLTENEKKNLVRSIELVSSVEYWLTMNIINVVDFLGDSIKGTAEVVHGGEVKSINLARKILDNESDLLQTLVHEVAHKYGDDSDNNHENNQYRIFAEIISSNLMK